MDLSRRTTFLEAVLVSLLVVAVVGTGITVLSQFGIGPDRPLSVQAELRTPPPGLGASDSTAAVVVREPVTATVDVSDPTVLQRGSLVGSSLVSGLTILAVLLLLRRIAGTVREGGFFVADNARRLERLATVVLVGGMAAQLLEALGRHAVLGAPEVADRVVMSAEIAFLPVVAAVGLRILAEVFRQGVTLREDVEGLV